MSHDQSADRPGQGTLGIHAGARSSDTGAVVPPIVQSATFLGGGANDPGELLYTRYGNNPNQVEVADKVAALEGMEAGVALGSGMAATSMTVLAATRAGDHLVASRYLYGATRVFLEHEMSKRGLRTDFVDPTLARNWRVALTAETRMLFLEIPTNPTLRLFDPRPIAKLAQEAGILLVVDSTFASPINLRCGELGVDAVIHSATKYLGGHSDLIAGVVTGSSILMGEVRHASKMYGPALDPHAAWLLSRGIRTLAVRMRKHNENAMALAQWFRDQAEVEHVIYPGLESHPDHALASEILDGFGGMLSVILQGGGPAADVFGDALRLALQAPSLGGVETLVSQPRFTSHVDFTAAERADLGLPDGLVRISVGLEDVDDLIRDFGQALRRVAAGSPA